MTTRLRRTAADQREGFTAFEVGELARAWEAAGVPEGAQVKATVTMRGRLKSLEVEIADPAPVKRP